MAIKNLSEIIESARTIIGENTSDEALAFMEDLSDTMTDFDNKTKDATNWQERYQQNDAMWRKKYADRFNGKPVEEEDDSYELPEPPKKTYLDLFEEVKPNA